MPQPAEFNLSRKVISNFRFGSPLNNFLLLTFAFFISLEVFNFEIVRPSTDYFSTHLRHFADALFLALPVLLTRKKWFITTYILIVTAYIQSNVWYFRNYGTLMPFSSYLLFENLDGLGPSIRYSMRLLDLCIVLPPLAFLIYIDLSKKEYVRTFYNRLIPLFSALLFIELIIFPSYVIKNPAVNTYAYDSGKAFKRFGLINYWIYEIRKHRTISQDEKQELSIFLENYYSQNDSLSCSALSINKNLILIILESFQSYPINLVLEGDTITPNLNKLIKENSTLYFPYVVPQVKGGASSDAHLMINTGLLPIADGSAASLYGSNKYPSLGNQLKKHGYQTVSVICEKGDIWNQYITSQSYGFDSLHDQTALDAEAPYQDEKLFKKGGEYIEKLNQPFFAQLVTMSGHDPLPIKGKPHLSNLKSIQSQEVRNYLAITQYVDSCLGDFIRNLKNSGIYENSIIVITGDHDSRQVAKNKFENRKEKLLTDRFVPLIILNSPINMQTKDTCGQIDIYPTILDLMGIGNTPWRGLGFSLVREHPKGVVLPDQRPLGTLTPENKTMLSNRWRMSDLIIRSKTELRTE